MRVSSLYAVTESHLVVLCSLVIPLQIAYWKRCLARARARALSSVSCHGNLWTDATAGSQRFFILQRLTAKPLSLLTP